MTQQTAWKHFEAISRYALSVAPRTYLSDIRARLRDSQIPAAVMRRDTSAIFNWLVDVSQFQGISDANAIAYGRRHGLIEWGDVFPDIESSPSCPRLRCFWAFDRCGYRKTTHSCAEPSYLGFCSLPTHPARKGSLTVAAHSLALFIRDVCDGDFLGWIDQRLADADPGPAAADRSELMTAALLGPLTGIYGIGHKVWSMALADLLLAGDPNRERWMTTGAGMVVIDTLMHNFLHRTGVLRRFEADHAYGPQCYGLGGCAGLIRGLASRIDARQFNQEFPACFPRFVQSAVWRMCSASELNICNGNRIDDQNRCENYVCPAFNICDRIALYDLRTSHTQH